ncbi:MAG: sulfotransferase [Rhodothermales bacterium]
MLPNFLCIGAQKSGTTTLLRQLGKHPDIFMSPARETRFFLTDYLYSQGLDAYEIDFFAEWNGEKAAGEKTPEYLCDPLVPRRIYESLGQEMKFIATFRSPAQRAYAQYRHNFQYLRETVDFDNALALEPARCQLGRYHTLRFGYLWRGRYADQIERYLEYFPKGAFFFVVYEDDIVREQAQTLSSIFEFLGVDTGFDPGGDVSAGRSLTLEPTIVETGQTIDLDGVGVEAKRGDILLTRRGIRSRLIRNPSPSLTARAKAAQQHLPQEFSLPRTKELELNNTHFRDCILRLQDILDRDLHFWLQ